MQKTRLEAFSDGVIAIIITIMVLELHAPHAGTLEALQSIAVPFLGYVLSFVYVGIYWNNHHHMLHAAKLVDGSVLWANLHLLFWLSLFPFVTNWMGESHWATLPTAAYGAVLFLASAAYWILQQAIIRQEGNESILKEAIGRDFKGKLSPVLYMIGIVVSFWHPSISAAVYTIVALIWLTPDRRIARVIAE